MQAFNFFIGYPNPMIPAQYPQPDNWENAMIELSFENLEPEGVFNMTNLVWKGQTAGIMNAWLLGGRTGDVGIYEGIPLQIYLCTTNELVFDGIIDLTDPETKFSCDIVSVKIRDKKMDMFNQLFGSISYTLLESLSAGQPGCITAGCVTGTSYSGLGAGDYVPIAYQRNDIPNMQTILQCVMIMWQIWEMVQAIENAIEKGIDYLMDAIAGYPAIGDIIVNAALSILYFVLAALISAFALSLTLAAINCLIAPVLVKFGMYANTLIQKACDYFGIGFSSSILGGNAYGTITTGDPTYSRLVLMPQKSAWAMNENFSIQIKNLLSAGTLDRMMEYDDGYNLSNGGYAYGYYEGTPQQLINSLEEVFCAKAKIINDSLGRPVLHFERWDFQYQQSQYSLPNISDQVPFNSKGLFNITGISQSAFSTNADEIMANYSVSYALDNNDYNTLNYYDGTSCFCTITPNTYTGAALVGTSSSHVLLKGIKEIQFEFSKAKRKEFEQPLEKLFAAAYQFIVTTLEITLTPVTLGLIFAVTNSWPTPSALNFTKTGHLYLSGDSTSQPKMFIAGATQTYKGTFKTPWFSRTFTAVTVDSNNTGQTNIGASNLSARTLFKLFHYSKLPKYTTPPGGSYASPYNTNTVGYNQWLVYKNQTVPMCCADYDVIKNNNYILVPFMQGMPTSGIASTNLIAKIDSVRFNPFKGQAVIDYRVMVPYTFNISEQFNVDGWNAEGTGSPNPTGAGFNPVSGVANSTWNKLITDTSQL